MTPLSNDERRALALLAALVLLASAARWLERPRPLLEGAGAVDLAALESASRDAKEGRGAAAAVRVDPNRADAVQLERLTGVGPALAARIIAERERAPFRSVADMQRVAGIGPAMSAKLAPQLTLPAEAAAVATGAAVANGAPRVAVSAGAGGAPAAAGPASASAAATAAVPARIDLNRAGASELESIAGIGPALAARILARRDSLGRFRSYDDVDAVRGVGPALLARIRAVTLDPSS